MVDDDDPLTAKLLEAAQQARYYMKLFPFGHIVWIGPGSADVWECNERSPPYKWQPWADKFTSILAESGQPILKGGAALSKGELRNGCKNEHFTGTFKNQALLTIIL